MSRIQWLSKDEFEVVKGGRQERGGGADTHLTPPIWSQLESKTQFHGVGGRLWLHFPLASIMVIDRCVCGHFYCVLTLKSTAIGFCVNTAPDPAVVMNHGDYTLGTDSSPSPPDHTPPHMIERAVGFLI